MVRFKLLAAKSIVKTSAYKKSAAFEDPKDTLDRDDTISMLTSVVFSLARFQSYDECLSHSLC